MVRRKRWRDKSKPRLPADCTKLNHSAGLVDGERPRAHLRGVHLDKAESVEARNARAGVDVPAVGRAPDVLHRLVSMHERSQALHRSAPMPTDRVRRGFEAEEHIVGDRRGRGPEQTQRFRPSMVRRLRVHNPDRSVHRGDRDRKRHAAERSAPTWIPGVFPDGYAFVGLENGTKAILAASATPPPLGSVTHRLRLGGGLIVCPPRLRSQSSALDGNRIRFDDGFCERILPIDGNPSVVG